HESLEILRGGGPEDARRLTLELSARLLVQAGRATDIPAAMVILEAALGSGKAYERWEQMVAAQGGRLAELPPLASSRTLVAPRSGFITAMRGQRLGHAVIALGGGRKYVGQAIDPT
ncbi:MAG: thymidine phosphorylase, partial [Pirellulaceae bacterium]